jgi:carbonic anhydrase
LGAPQKNIKATPQVSRLELVIFKKTQVNIGLLAVNYHPLTGWIIALAAILILGFQTGFAAEPLTGEQALQKLLAGIQRHAATPARDPNPAAERRAETAKNQAPLALVLTCTDERVSPEAIFDQRSGDLQVVRNVGNVLDDQALASIEYAVKHLHTPLIIVLGHSRCEAVSAAVAAGMASDHSASIVAPLVPAVEEARVRPGNRMDNTMRINALRTTNRIKRSEPILHEAVEQSKVKVVAARYDSETGLVEILR